MINQQQSTYQSREPVQTNQATTESRRSLQRAHTMGLFDLFGTTASGWLTDRLDPRRLLAVYYGLGWISLTALPLMDFGPVSLGAFAILFGLDPIATVPSTVKPANQAFGDRDGPIMFGWVLVTHQIGGAVAAYGAGMIRTQTGTYVPAFVLAGGAAMVASLVFTLALQRHRDNSDRVQMARKTPG